MAEMTVVACRPDFRSASEHARSLAREYSRQTSVRCTIGGWDVLVDSDIALQMVEEADDDQHSDSDDEVERFDDAELCAEINDNMESWERSEETGWYYSDE